MDRRFIFLTTSLTIVLAGAIGSFGYFVWCRRKKLASKNLVVQQDLEQVQAEEDDDQVTEPVHVERDSDIMAASNSLDEISKSPSVSNSTELVSLNSSVASDSSNSPQLETSQSSLPQETISTEDSGKPTDATIIVSDSEDVDPSTPLKPARSRKPQAVYVPPPARPMPRKHEQPRPPMSSAPASSPIAFITTIKIPLWLVKRFIGRQGEGIKSLRHSSGAELKVPRNRRVNCSHTACNISGSVHEIETALSLINQRFPEINIPQYPTFKPFYGTQKKPAVKESPKICTRIPAAIVPSTPFFAYLSHVQSLSSLWLQIASPMSPCPWHELYTKLNSTYSFVNSDVCEDDDDSDDDEVTHGLVGEYCAVKTSSGGFVRGHVKGLVSADSSSHSTASFVYSVYLVDHGNYVNVTGSRLTPLRTTHMELPAQAIHCCMANILPCPGVGVVEELRLIVGTHTLEAHVCGTEKFSLPTVELYLNKGEVQLCVNEELVRRGVATRLSEDC
ncbi:A-kinase anchor protein 1, mitochondrial-like isoform X2 [Dysidea avara]|uniref:A-kinase anchor protein 1, mitochondrial-like isoform X2 n=1 Tax=Dysidea avara TaxID=196820 RepID=UPI00332619BB